MANYAFFQNKDCEYFPCHSCADPGNFNCLFCYCPLYSLGENCGGNFRYTDSGIKDCSDCLRPHRRDCYDAIVNSMKGILELAKKKPENP